MAKTTGNIEIRNGVTVLVVKSSILRTKSGAIKKMLSLGQVDLVELTDGFKESLALVHMTRPNNRPAALAEPKLPPGKVSI